MSRATVLLTNKATREKAARWCLNAPPMTRVEFKANKRSIPQNDRMHAMLTDIATQMPIWGGAKVTKDDWKLIFLDALKREMRLVPNLDGTGVVALSGKSSSDLSVAEMTDMIEVMFAFGAANNITFHDGSNGAAEANNLPAVAS